MKLGIIGRGRWGNVYAETLRRMGIPFWQASRDWHKQGNADGIIIATNPASHHALARRLMFRYCPIIIEKPLCLFRKEAKDLMLLADESSIVKVGHTRLYSDAWRKFKLNAIIEGVKSVEAVAGSDDTTVKPHWDWGPHLVAMCLDLGFDPLKAKITTSSENIPLRVVVNGNLVYTDQPETPTPMERLIGEFVSAIELGEQDISDLELGVKVVETLSQMETKKAPT